MLPAVTGGPDRVAQGALDELPDGSRCGYVNPMQFPARVAAVIGKAMAGNSVVPFDGLHDARPGLGENKSIRPDRLPRSGSRSPEVRSPGRVPRPGDGHRPR